MISVWRLKAVVWQEREEAVGIFVAIFKLDYFIVWFEALETIIICSWFWNDTEKDVIFHKAVKRLCVTRETINQNPKVSAREQRVGLDQGIPLTAVHLFLQLQQNIFLVLEKGVDNILSICSSSETARKESKSSALYRHLAVHLDRIFIWQGLDFIHPTYCSRLEILNFSAVPVKLLKYAGFVGLQILQIFVSVYFNRRVKFEHTNDLLQADLGVFNPSGLRGIYVECVTEM